MQGVIINIGTTQSLIQGDNGSRYMFTTLNWRDEGTEPEIGMRVVFEAQGPYAVGVHPATGRAHA